MLGQGADESDGTDGEGVNGTGKSNGKSSGDRPVVAAMKEAVEPYVRGTLDNWIK